MNDPNPKIMNQEKLAQTIDPNSVEPLTIKRLLEEWPDRISNLRAGEKSAFSHGQMQIGKWYEGQADAIDRCLMELEVAVKHSNTP